MILFPNCKINLGLTVLDKRSDGFHNIETVFFPINIRDVIEVVVSSSHKKDIIFSSTGQKIDGNEENNLCVKAYRLLKKDYPSIPPIQFHLHKNIPMGAGLGGGSADAAFTLKLLNKKFDLNLTINQLNKYALDLGSDCPFFITNQPSLAKGRGEILQPIEINLTPYKILIVNPRIHINTAWAFQELSLSLKQEKAQVLEEIIEHPVDEWKIFLKNDFEGIVFKKYDEIKKIKDNLYQSGAVYASMSGTGSTIFGIFKNNSKYPSDFPKNYFIQQIQVNEKL